MNDTTEQVVTAEQIYTAISKQAFQDWYTKGNWDQYITGDVDHSYFEIIQQIRDLFGMQ